MALRSPADADRVYRLALERRAIGGPFHAVAEVIGRRLNVPVVSKSKEEAAQHFGWFAPFVGVDCLNSSVGAAWFWEPKQPGLLADFDHPGYFET